MTKPSGPNAVLSVTDLRNLESQMCSCQDQDMEKAAQNYTDMNSIVWTHFDQTAPNPKDSIETSCIDCKAGITYGWFTSDPVSGMNKDLCFDCARQKGFPALTRAQRAGGL
jgi:hypothetical protein